MAKDEVLTCCYMETAELASACDAPAEWEIRHGYGPCDYTHSCELHVWKMITDAPKHWIGSLDSLHEFTLIKKAEGKE